MSVIKERINNALKLGLKSLDLTALKLSTLPDYLLDYDLFYEIDLSFNSFIDLPDILLKLKQLRELDLSHNCISSFSSIDTKLINQSNIRHINFSRNNFSTVPYFALELDPEWTSINFDENPIFKLVPDFLLSDDYQAAIEFLDFATASSQLTPFYEGKMTVVGQGEVGKTSLIKKLIDPEYELLSEGEATTKGIKIDEWNIPVTRAEKDWPISAYSEYDETYYDDEDTEDTKALAKINIWDFGGQEVYYNIHQFFLTDQTLYLLVWDARKEETSQNFDYWINTIRLLGQESPLIIVMNKSDVRTRNISEDELQQNFPNIKGFFRVSVKTNYGIDRLRNFISEIIDDLPVIGINIPKTWLTIKEQLLRESRDYIEYEEYLQVFKRFYKGGMDSNRNSHNLIIYLRRLGSLLYYPNDQLLSDIVILNPEWATAAFYLLIDNSDVQKANGRFNYSSLKTIWNSKNYPRYSHHYLLRLLEKFGICFKLIGTNDYFVPDLLEYNAASESERFSQKPRLKFHYEFDFVPAGVLPRFICQIHEFIRSNSFWRTGLIVGYKDSEALITESGINKRIEIVVISEDRVQLLAVIRNKFDTVFKSLDIKRDLDYKEYIPCTCLNCENVDSPHFYSMQVLDRYKSKGKKVIVCPDSVEEVEINYLVNGYRKQADKPNILNDLLIVCSQLQGNIMGIKKKEDDRNAFVNVGLKNRMIKSSDQSRWGVSESGKQAGEIDIKIESKEGATIGIFEGMNLSSVNSEKITTHFNKLFGYDPNGLSENYLVTYSDSKNFLSFYTRYSKFIHKINSKYELIKPFEDISHLHSHGNEIRVGLTTYLRQKRLSRIYHIFVNLHQGGN